MSEFVETETLLAVLDGDSDAMRDRVAKMLPFERRALAKACDILAAECQAYCDGCGQRVDEHGPFALVSRGTWHPDCARELLAVAGGQ